MLLYQVTNQIRRKPYFFHRFCSIQALDFIEYDSDSQNPNPNPNFYRSPQNTYQIEHQRLRMQQMAKIGNLEEALRTLHSLNPTILDYNALLHSYLKSGNVTVDKVFLIYNVMKPSGPWPNVWTFNILANGLCSLGMIKDAFFFLEEMCTCRFVPSFKLLTRLLKKCISTNLVELSIGVHELMLRFGYSPSLYVLNTFIANLIRAGWVSEAYYIFKAFLDSGLLPDVYTCNSILFGLCRSGLSYNALALLGCLMKRGFSCNVYTCTSLVLGFSKQGLWEEAYRVLDQMQMLSDGNMPNVVTYTVLIKFLCQYKRVDEGFRILEMMRKQGCCPDLVTYNVLLSGLCGEDRFQDAYSLMCDMVREGILPDHYTRCVFAAGFLKAGHPRECQNILKVFSEGNTIDVVMWNIYLHSLCKDNKVEEAVSVVDSMMEKGFLPNTVTRNTVLKGLCTETHLNRALDFLDHFDSERNKPDLVSFNTVLSAACKQVNSSMIRKVLYRMVVGGYELDVVSMTCLIQYFGKIGESEDCFALFNYLFNKQQFPTIITYNVFLDALCRKGHLLDAHKMLKEFKCIGTFPDTASYNILINAYIRKGDYSAAEGLLDDMYSQGLAPDAITYGSLSYGLCKEGKIKNALNLQHKMIDQGVKPSVSYYNNILAAMFRGGKLEDARKFLYKMSLEGIEPDAASYIIFKNAMAKGGKKLKAMKDIEILMNGGECQSVHVDDRLLTSSL